MELKQHMSCKAIVRLRRDIPTSRFIHKKVGEASLGTNMIHCDGTLISTFEWVRWMRGEIMSKLLLDLVRDSDATEIAQQQRTKKKQANNWIRAMVFINEKSFREVVTDSFLITFRLSCAAAAQCIKWRPMMESQRRPQQHSAAQREKQRSEKKRRMRIMILKHENVAVSLVPWPLACHLINDIVECGSKFSRRRQRESEKEK